MFGIQRTIAIGYEWHDEFKGNMKKSVDYAMRVYGIKGKKHRYLIRLYEHLYPELRIRASLETKTMQELKQ